MKIVTKINEKRHKIFFRFLISHIFILSIPLFLSTFAYNEALSILNVNAQKSNLSILEQCKDILDRRIEEIDNMVIQLAYNPKVVQLLREYNPLIEGRTTVKINSLSKDIVYYKLQNSFIRTFYIYFKRSNMIISPERSCIRLPMFYEQLFKHGEIPYEEWNKTVLNGSFQKKALPSISITFNNCDKQVLPYIQSIPLDSINNPKGTIVVFIDIDEIHNLLCRLRISDGGWVYIADQNGNIMTSLSSNDMKIPQLAKIKTEDGNGYTKMVLQGEEMVISYTTSSLNGWKYVTGLPSRIVMNEVKYIKRIIWEVIAICALIGILSAYYVAYRNSIPIKNLIRSIKKELSGNQKDSENELDFLETTIKKLIENNKTIHNDMERYVPLVKAMFFEHIINGNFSDFDEIRGYLPYIHVNIKEGKTIAMIVHMRIQGYSGRVNKDILQILNIIKSLIKRTLDQEMDDYGYFHDVDFDKIVLLLTINKEQENNIKFHVHSLVEKIQQTVLSVYSGLDLYFSVGNLVDSIIESNYSYNQALQALEYKVRNKKFNITWYNSIPNTSQEYYFYPLDLEQQIINYVKTGKSEKIEKVVLYIFKENFLRRSLSPKMIRQLVNDMCGTIIKAMYHVCHQEGLKSDVRRQIEYLETCLDLDELKIAIIDIYTSLCELANGQKRNHQAQLIEAVIDYMNTAYADVDLGLSKVAQKFYITEVYLSQLFKEQTFENFSNYLENIRIRKACDLLEDSNLSVTEISKMVGYNSDHAFRRAFKRRMGVTPTAYKSYGGSMKEQLTME